MARDTTAGGNGAEKPAKGRGAYLPVLPEGWSYKVHIDGPDGSIRVAPLGSAGKHGVRVIPEGKLDQREFTKPSLSEAVRAAASAVKSLAKLSKHEAEVEAARKALLDEIGGPPNPVDTEAARETLAGRQSGQEAGREAG